MMTVTLTEAERTALVRLLTYAVDWREPPTPYANQYTCCNGIGAHFACAPVTRAVVPVYLRTLQRLETTVERYKRVGDMV